MMRRLALLNCFLVLALLGGTLALAALIVAEGGSASQLVETAVVGPLVVLVSVLAYLIITRRPGNLIGQLFSATSLFVSLLAIVEAYLEYGLDASPGSVPNIELAAWVSEWIFVPAILPLITFLFLLCPDGRLPSRRWRPVALAVAVNLTILTLAIMVSPFETRPEIDNPFRIAALGSLPEVVMFLGYAGLLPSIGLSGAAMVQRFRRSTGIERLQLKWFASAAVGALGLWLAAWAVSPFVESDAIWGIALGGSVALVVIATATAILRYGLYNIDLIINRTLVYVPLTAILAGLFVAVTGLIRALFTNLTDAGSDAATAMSTLAVVALLTPVKNQLQALVDRRFKEQHDPQKALKQLVIEANSVARIMDRDHFIESVLEEITAAFDLAGATVELAGANGRQPKSFGHVGDASPVSLPLTYFDRHVGRLLVWLHEDRGIDESHLIESLEAPAGALAQVICLIPETLPQQPRDRRSHDRGRV
jgi:hypothetical protein